MYLTQALHRSVQQMPNEPATIFGDRTRTWAESFTRVSRLAAALRALGVAPGDRVGMLSLNSDYYHEYLFGVPWADAVVVPLNVRWSPSENAYAVTDAGIKVLLVDDTHAPMVPRIRQESDVIETVIHCGEGPTPDGAVSYEELLAAHEPVEDARRGGDELAAIFYTGGTTGHPKGVMLSHANILVSALGGAATGHLAAPGARALHVAPMFHLAAVTGWLLCGLLGGCHVILARFDPGETAAAIERHRVTDALLPIPMVQMLVDSSSAETADLSSLRRVLYGTAPISESLLQRASKRMPTAAFAQAYGMTELAPFATILGPEDHQDARLRRSGGRAAPHAEVRIVDPDGNEVPRGVVGEVVVRGSHVMLGYWNKPEETAHAVRDGWMHTGDGAYMDDAGYVYIVDRLKDMIITGGENVYSTEVENALARHPSVAACAVIGVPDPQWGERVHAVVVPREGTSPTVEELREHCKQLIAGYKAPRSVEFVDAMPLSGAGKVLKTELRKKHWAGHDRAVS